MEIKEFDDVYLNTKNKCVVTYHEDEGRNRKGVAISGVTSSLNGTLFVWVDNFANRVNFDKVISIKDSGIPWI